MESEIGHSRSGAAAAGDARLRAFRCLAILAGAAALYALFWRIEPPDMHLFLYPWLEHIRAAGPWRAFAAPFSNYTPTYLYLLALVEPLTRLIPAMTVIKLLSVAGTLWLALAMRRLLLAAGVAEAGSTALLVLLVPTVALNAALLGQCDALWAAPCLLAVAASLEGRTVRTLLWWGLALAVKGQALFLGPFVAAFLLSQRAPLRLWLLPGAVYALVMLPAWLEGWPALHLATIYVRPSGYYEYISMNAPNLWELVLRAHGSDLLAVVPVAFALAAAAGLAFVIRFRRIGRDQLLAAALLSALIVPGLLPRMHDRYFFLADMLAFALAAQRRDREGRTLFLAIQLGSLGALTGYWIGALAFGIAGAIVMIAATLALAANLALPQGLGGLRKRIRVVA